MKEDSTIVTESYRNRIAKKSELSLLSQKEPGKKETSNETHYPYLES